MVIFQSQKGTYEQGSEPPVSVTVREFLDMLRVFFFNISIMNSHRVTGISKRKVFKLAILLLSTQYI